MIRFNLLWKGKSAWDAKTRKGRFEWEPELSWLFAAQWWHIDPEEFAHRDGDIQSLMVATYQAHTQIEGILAYDQDQRMERANRSTEPAPKNPPGQRGARGGRR